MAQDELPQLSRPPSRQEIANLRTFIEEQEDYLSRLNEMLNTVDNPREERAILSDREKARVNLGKFYIGLREAGIDLKRGDRSGN